MRRTIFGCRSNNREECASRCQASVDRLARRTALEYSKKPLDGIVVIDFTRVFSGPYCTMLLADLGATVLKVERKGIGDDSRAFLPVEGGESGYYMYLNRNKKSIELDLKDQQAVEIVYRLSKNADVIVENYAPGVADRLKIGYEDIKAHNPDIIYGSISGFGQTGPYRAKAAYDVVAQAMGGYMDITGFPDGPPIKLGASVVDAAAGLYMAFAVVSALYQKKSTGAGQFIDVAMMDTVIAMMENFVVMQTFGQMTPTRNGNRNLGAAPFNVYKTKDDYVAIAVANNFLFEKFCPVIGRPDLITNPLYADNKCRKANEDSMDAIVEEWTLQHTTEEVCKLLDEAKVPVGPILNLQQVVEDPHVLSREMIVEIDHPTEGKVKVPGNPMKFSESKIDRFVPSPLLGADTLDILRDYAGFSDEEIRRCEQDGVIVQRDYAGAQTRKL